MIFNGVSISIENLLNFENVNSLDVSGILRFDKTCEFFHLLEGSLSKLNSFILRNVSFTIAVDLLL